jgi:hypothetical protein
MARNGANQRHDWLFEYDAMRVEIQRSIGASTRRAIV